MTTKRRRRFASGFRIAIVTGAITLFACTDLTRSPTAPAANGKHSVSDFVAAGMVYNTIWQPGPTGLVLRGATLVPLQVSSKNGVVTTTLTGTPTRDSSLGTAQGLKVEMTAARGTIPGVPANLSPRASGTLGKIAKSSLMAKTIARRTIDGTAIRIAASPDDDKASGRPPKAMVVWKDNRVAAILEFTFARSGGVWRAVKTRTTFLDSAGHVSLVSDQDATGLSDQSVASSGSSALNRGDSGHPFRALARLALPDMLYAAAIDDSSDAVLCLSELEAVAITALVVVSAGANVVAANAAQLGADAAYAAALASCVDAPTTCYIAIGLAVTAQISAAAWVLSANTGLAAAIAAAGIATTALGTCLINSRKPDTQTGPSGGGGGESGCQGGQEEWCEYTVWYNGYGDVVGVDQDGCWCQWAE